MARPRTGSAYVRHGTLVLAVTTWRPNAEKPRWTQTRPDLDARDAAHRARAKAAAAFLQKQYDREPPEWDPWAPVVERAAETVRAYGKRWCDDRATRRGLRSVREDRSRLEHHVYPHVGDLAIAAVTTGDVEGVRDHLDDCIAAGTLAAKTAANIWTVVTKLFRDACRSKVRELRARDDNPAAGVEPPEQGDARAKVYLYPSESTALLACDAVPLARAEAYAVLERAYLRAGELAALRCEDVDLEHDDIHVHRAMDVKTGAVHEPKTAAGNRHVPIEPCLKPLLARLIARRGGTGPLFPDVRPWLQREAARDLRADLRAAGVTREALFARDATRLNLRAHDLRAGGITWRCVRGDEPVRIQRAAGHETFETTLGYIREADDRRAGFGRVFPPLPPRLLAGEGSAPGFAPGDGGDAVSSRESRESRLCPRRGSNPREPRPGATRARHDATSSAPALTGATADDPARRGFAPTGALRDALVREWREALAVETERGPWGWEVGDA